MSLNLGVNNGEGKKRDVTNHGQIDIDIQV